MPYRVQPHVAGQLGPNTQLDPSVHPPTVSRVEYLLDAPAPDDLIESFPVVLASTALAGALEDARFHGLTFTVASVRPSAEYVALYGAVPHSQYRWMQIGPADMPDAWFDDESRLCVSDRAMQTIRRHNVARCVVEPI